MLMFYHIVLPLMCSATFELCTFVVNAVNANVFNELNDDVLK